MMTRLAVLTVLPLVSANFDAAAQTRAQSVVRSILEDPVVHSKLLQDGFRSGFFLEDPAGVNYDGLEKLMYAQIRTLSQSFYHLWAGFENGAFLGYYQAGTNSPTDYTLAWQSDENHACAHPYTDAAWNKALSVPASGLGDVPAPSPPAATLPAFCRETHLVDADFGSKGASISGAPYDCRKRGWYFNAKSNLKKQWSGMYVDRTTNEPAFALCLPLFNSSATVPAGGTYTDGLTPDNNGLLGVACTGLYIESLSAELRANFPDMSTMGSFIVERSSGLLVAASVPTMSDYYDVATTSRVAATASNNDLIRWASTHLVAAEEGAVWSATGTSYVITLWIEAADAAAYPSLVVGDAYFVSSEVLEENGVVWDVVVVQRVHCSPGFFMDAELLICVECEFPAFSSGNAPTFCNRCTNDYFMLDRECTSCPEGATCDGSTDAASLELLAGYWRVSADTGIVRACPYDGACVGGANFSNAGGEYCAAGHMGPLCAVCEPLAYYYDTELNMCSPCDEGKGVGATIASTPLAGKMAAIAFAAVAMGFGIFYYVAPEDQRNSVLLALEKQGDRISAVRSQIKSAQIKIKTLTSYFQIMLSVGFNCAVAFPTMFQRVSTALEFVNIDLLPAFNLDCRQAKFDFADEVVVMMLGPLFLSAGIWLAYFYVTNKKRHVSPRAGKRYIVPKTLKHAFKEDELANFRKIFAFYDINGNRSIEKSELAKVMTLFNDRLKEKNAWKEGLSDSDDDELKEATAEKAKEKDATESDSDESKILDEAEIAAGVDNIMAEADASGDDKISFGEFLLIMLKARRQHKDFKFATLSNKVDAELNRAAGQTLIYYFLFITFLTLAGNSSMLFQYLKCHDFPESSENDGDAYLYADYSMDCNGKRYKAYLPFVYAMICVYPIGIPLLYFLMLRGRKSTLSDPDAMEREADNDYPTTGHLVFLCESYKPKFWFFEVTECFRRLVLASVIGLLDSDSAATPVLGLVFCYMYTWVFTALRPFKNEDNNRLSVTLSYSLGGIYIAALMIKIDETSEEGSLEAHVFDGGLVAVVMAGPIAILFQYTKFYINCLCAPCLSFAAKHLGDDEELDDANKAEESFIKDLEAGDASKSAVIAAGRFDKSGKRRRKSLEAVQLFKQKKKAKAAEAAAGGAKNTATESAKEVKRAKKDERAKAGALIAPRSTSVRSPPPRQRGAKRSNSRPIVEEI